MTNTSLLVASKILATRDNKSKVRLAFIYLFKENDVYVIRRKTGLATGKKLEGPVITITKGLVKRTILEQAELRYNSLVKEYLDKGYKDITTEYSTNPEKVEEYVPTIVTNQHGIVKPMLAKIIDWQDVTLTKRRWAIQRKLDGVKALFFYRNGEVHTSSRGGQDYDIPTTYIRTNPEIVAFFEKHPSVILDGELYIHGIPLEKISGLCRLEKLTEEHKNLQYHCYDIVNENLIYETRLETINEFIKEYSEKPLPYINWVETYYLSKADSLEDFRKNVMEIHDIFIKEGYEGAILRDLDATYKCGGRDKRMYKVKCFIDGEYKITGLSEGLREEDMSFELVTAEGYPFKAKPEGDRALKHWYHEHIKEMIGHWGTVRYFHMSNTEHPVPNLPVFCSWRLDKDMDNQSSNDQAK